MKKQVLIGVAISACVSAMAGAQSAETAAPPPLIPYIGAMTDASGAPLVGLSSAIFALYEDAIGGVPLWVDIQLVRTDATGEYMVLLGNASELPVDLFATHQSLWLGVQPTGQAEQPRERFLSVPYALKARDADTLGGLPLSEFVLLGDGPGRGGALSPDGTGSSEGLINTAEDVLADLTVTGDSHLLGAVGIGTASPLALFTVTANDPKIYLNDSGGSPSGDWSIRDADDALRIRDESAGVDRLLVDAFGRVGIGTTSPNALLQLTGNDPKIYFNDNGGAPTGNWSIRDSDHSVRIRDETSGVDRFMIDSSGNVGIGTTSPSATLHVAGNVTVDGNIAAKYQDVAEWVDAVGDPTPGMVVIADITGRNRVRIADGSYDTKVLGAVSAQPGVVLGEPGPHRVLVAQSGRVMVKVDARYGAIAAGDLLSTSPTAGYAMVSEPLAYGELRMHRPGTVLGKALEPWSEGQGEILVLLTLQ